MPASQTGRRARRRMKPALSAWSPGAAAASFCWRTVPSANSSAAPRARIASTHPTLFREPLGGLDQLPRRELEPGAQLEDGPDGGALLAALDLPHVGGVDPGPVGQGLLREAPLLAKPPHGEAEGDGGG